MVAQWPANGSRAEADQEEVVAAYHMARGAAAVGCNWPKFYFEYMHR